MVAYRNNVSGVSPFLSTEDFNSSIGNFTGTSENVSSLPSNLSLHYCIIQYPRKYSTTFYIYSCRKTTAPHIIRAIQFWAASRLALSVAFTRTRVAVKLSVTAKWAIWKLVSSRRRRTCPTIRTDIRVWNQLWVHIVYLEIVILTCRS